MVKLTVAQWAKTLYEVTKDIKVGSKEFERAIEVFAGMLQCLFSSVLLY